MPRKRGLTDKQKRFVEEYLIDLNATQAAIRAGFSAKSAEVQGYQLLHKPLVRDEIAREMAERSRRTGINQDRVLREIARVAFVNPDKIINFSTGELKDNADPDDLACLAGVKVKTMDMGDDGGLMVEREIKLNDKIKALDMLCKHLGLYEGDGKKRPGASGGDTGGEKETGVILMPEVARPEQPPDDDGGGMEGA